VTFEGAAPACRQRPWAVTILLLGLVALGGRHVAGQEIAAAGDAPPAATGPSQASRQYRDAFGYTIGEERRYVLEPERSLRSGESAWWSIVLADIRGEGDRLEIDFDLEHQRTEVYRDVFSGPSGRLQTITADSRVTMNRFGFPERVVLNEQHDVSGETGSLSDARTTVFTFDGERYVKQVRIDGHEWTFNIAIASHRGLDLAAQTGLYLFMPSALRCLGHQGVPGRPARCNDGEIAFANPGLLSVALPVLWEEQVNEKELLFFKPDGVGTTPSGLMNMGDWVRRERDQLGSITRYFGRAKLEFREYVEQIEVGPRTVGGWKVDAGGSMRELYTDGNGTVLRVEIDPHPVTNGRRWIRLLYPSEY